VRCNPACAQSIKLAGAHSLAFRNVAHGPVGFEQVVQIARPGLQIGGLAKCSEMEGLFVAVQAPPEVVRVDGATGAVLANASIEFDAAIMRPGGQLKSLACTPPSWHCNAHRDL